MKDFLVSKFAFSNATCTATARDGAEFQGRALSIARSLPPPGGKGGGGERGDKAGGAGAGGGGGGGDVCYAFQKGECKRGAGCKFSHGEGGGGAKGDKAVGAGAGAPRVGPKGLGFSGGGMMLRAARPQPAAACGGAAAAAAAPAVAVKKPKLDAGADAEFGSGSGTVGEKPKSNSDFRAMFLSGFKKGSNLE
jgi:hypothetical protein